MKAVSWIFTWMLLVWALALPALAAEVAPAQAIRRCNSCQAMSMRRTEIYETPWITTGQAACAEGGAGCTDACQMRAVVCTYVCGSCGVGCAETRTERCTVHGTPAYPTTEANGVVCAHCGAGTACLLEQHYTPWITQEDVSCQDGAGAYRDAARQRQSVDTYVCSSCGFGSITHHAEHQTVHCHGTAHHAQAHSGGHHSGHH